MKKILLIFIYLLFFFVNAEALKGGVSETFIPKGFFGTWGVISKLESSNNPDMFNFESKDIWILSAIGNTLILENLESNAHSEITIKDKSINGKTLKFEKIKKVPSKNGKTLYREIVEFTLSGNNFSGYDKFIVEKYDLDNKLIKQNIANYIVTGIKISGNTEYK